MATLTVTSTADSGAGSLRQAISDAGVGDTIVFDNSLEVGGVITIELSSAITISKSLVIDGGTYSGSGETLQTRVILDGQEASRILFVSSASTSLTFSGVSFVNSYVTGYNYGGCVSCSGTSTDGATFNYCVFKDLQAERNGNIYLAGNCNVNFNNCLFINAATTYNGGALYCQNNRTNYLTNCVFKNCTAANGGGVFASSVPSLIIDNCTFDAAPVSIAGAVTIKNFVITNSLTTSTNIFTFDGVDAVLTVTTTFRGASATYSAATDSRGYLALPSGATTPTVGTGILVCTYGADLLTFSADVDGATWTATNLSTPILIEKQNGSAWTALTANATGGSYSTTFAEGDTARGFDGAKFLSFTIPVTPPPTPTDSYHELTAYTTIGYLKANYSTGYLTTKNSIGYLN